MNGKRLHFEMVPGPQNAAAAMNCDAPGPKPWIPGCVRLLPVLLIALLSLQWTLADSVINGRIRDTTTGLLPGVVVRLINQDSEVVRTTISDARGEFLFSNLGPGTYQLSAALSGFEQAQLTGLTLSPDEQQTVDLVLQVKSVEKKVWVEAPHSDIERVEAAIEPSLDAPEIPEPNEIFVRPDRELFLRGRVYSDWFTSSSEGQMSHQLSNRIKMEVGDAPGEGWTFRLDFRDRHRLGSNSGTRLILYDAQMIFDSQESPLFLSFGQMNLYDTAGIGQLLGATAGFKPTPNLLVGGYGGFSPELFDLNLDQGYKKFGFFARYVGPNALNLSVSLNELRFQGNSERRFVYVNGLAPVGRRMTFFGNLEYELGPNIQSVDRLSRLFLNARIELNDHIDVTTNFSSGRGLDYHRYLVEQSQELPNNPALDRFFFSTQYGVRLRFKLPHRVSFFLGQREAEEKDQQIRNHTTQLGLSAQDIGGSGFSANAGFNLNRGDKAESNSLYLMMSRTFGRVSWNCNYSTSFNSFRIDPSTGLPQLIHFDNLHTVSNSFFIVLTRAFAISAQYERSLGRSVEDLFFFRFIYRM